MPFSILNVFPRWIALVLAVLPVARAAEELPYSGPQIVGRMEAPPRNEASGLAASRRAPDLLWTHDDSGGQPVLYAVSTTGALRGAIRLSGVNNEDWEDVAAFTLDGKAWLLAADVGDNHSKRRTVQLHLLEEPAPDRLNPATEIALKPSYTLNLRYEDGPRDCESVAVDPATRTIYLLSKRDVPPRLYRVPLAPNAKVVGVARFVGIVPHVPLYDAGGVPLLDFAGKVLSMVTAMDFSADGAAAVVLTYSDPLLFARRPGESWPTAFARPPVRLAAHGLPQAEGVCFSPDGRFIYVTSERLPQLVRYERR